MSDKELMEIIKPQICCEEIYNYIDSSHITLLNIRGTDRAFLTVDSIQTRTCVIIRYCPWCGTKIENSIVL